MPRKPFVHGRFKRFVERLRDFYAKLYKITFLIPQNPHNNKRKMFPVRERLIPN